MGPHEVNKIKNKTKINKASVPQRKQSSRGMLQNRIKVLPAIILTED